jgi:hypothetical protein
MNASETGGRVCFLLLGAPSSCFTPQRFLSLKGLKEFERNFIIVAMFGIGPRLLAIAHGTNGSTISQLSPAPCPVLAISIDTQPPIINHPCFCCLKKHSRMLLLYCCLSNYSYVTQILLAPKTAKSTTSKYSSSALAKTGCLCRSYYYEVLGVGIARVVGQDISDRYASRNTSGDRPREYVSAQVNCRVLKLASRGR